MGSLLAYLAPRAVLEAQIKVEALVDAAAIVGGLGKLLLSGETTARWARLADTYTIYGTLSGIPAGQLDVRNDGLRWTHLEGRSRRAEAVMRIALRPGPYDVAQGYWTDAKSRAQELVRLLQSATRQLQDPINDVTAAEGEFKADAEPWIRFLDLMRMGAIAQRVEDATGAQARAAIGAGAWALEYEDTTVYRSRFARVLSWLRTKTRR